MTVDEQRLRGHEHEWRIGLDGGVCCASCMQCLGTDRMLAAFVERDGLLSELTAVRAEVERLTGNLSDARKWSGANLQESIRYELKWREADTDVNRLRALALEACDIASGHAEWNNDDKDVRRLAAIRAEVTRG